jgi:hypothetical protein
VAILEADPDTEFCGAPDQCGTDDEAEEKRLFGSDDEVVPDLRELDIFGSDNEVEETPASSRSKSLGRAGLSELGDMDEADLFGQDSDSDEAAAMPAAKSHRKRPRTRWSSAQLKSRSDATSSGRVGDNSLFVTECLSTTWTAAINKKMAQETKMQPVRDQARKANAALHMAEQQVRANGHELQCAEESEAQARRDDESNKSRQWMCGRH